MGTFATGVTVITSGEDDDFRAMTANAFTSVSLDPLSILVCVNQSSHMHGVISATGVFAVSVLARDQEALARACAKPDSPESALQGVPFTRGKTGSPLIGGSLAYIDCRVAASTAFGTHTIFVGEVIDLGAIAGDPLLFYKGQYATLS
jgi:flavin reductase (DIM6/NTAB) family NADH-FMN oxidoreductase RutF